MKHWIKIVLVITIFTAILSSCRSYAPPRTHHVFVIPEHRTRHHWGAPRTNSVKGRYWGQHRYGPRPNRYRGHYRD